MALVLVAAPLVEPLTGIEVLSRLGLEYSSPDADHLDDLIKSARQEIDGQDGWLGRALITQTWDLFIDEFPCEIQIPLPPLQSVVTVKYIDGNGVTQTWNAANYTVLPGGILSRVVPAFGVSWPSSRGQSNAVAVRFIAGYGNAGSDVPEPIRQWIVDKVNLSLSNRTDPLLRSESVDGAWSQTRVSGQDVDAVMRSMDDRLTRYRIW